MNSILGRTRFNCYINYTERFFTIKYNTYTYINKHAYKKCILKCSISLAGYYLVCFKNPKTK